MELHRFYLLFSQAKSISSRYKAVTALTGEKFNVFKILKIESSEVRMHSAFIAELLNPKGTHGQKDTFLKLFVKQFCFKGIEISTDTCKVEVEKHLGFISDDEKEGGRIDIVITDQNRNCVIIENKIYAKDGKFQLLRYHNYSQNADIIYLTLDGIEPSVISRHHLENGIHYKCASYKKDILDWLEACRKEVPTLPTVREGLSHYINLIKHLTNQTSSKEMKAELVEIISKNLEESFLICDHIDASCERLSKTFGEDLIESCKARGFVCDYNVNFNNRYSSIWIYKDDWKYFSIGFGFQNYDKDMRYGFLVDVDNTTVPKDIKERIQSLSNNHSSPSDQWWPWACPMEQPLNDWSKFPAWRAVLNGSMKDSLFRKVDELLDLTKDFTL